jgi:hypothetical protein
VGPVAILAPLLENKMPRNKRAEVLSYVLMYEAEHGKLPNRDQIVFSANVSNGTADVILYAIKESRNKVIGPIAPSKAQKSHIEAAIRMRRKELEKEFELRVQGKVKEYMAKHMPDLEHRREELSKKIARYDIMTNKFKPIFTIDEFKSILMCLHPDGERTKDRLESAFVSFKSKEVQLVGQIKK